MQRGRNKKKEEEKPSFLSKRVVRTQIRNEWENIRLEETFRQMNRDRYNKNYNFIKNTQDLNKRLLEIHKVKTKLSVSPERRLFARKHGFEIKAQDFEMNYFMRLLFDKEAFLDDLPSPLIRVQDLKFAEEVEEMEKVLAKKQEKEDTTPKQQEIIIDTARHGTLQKVRKIEPPKKGREMWKFHLEKRQVEREGVMSQEQETELQQVVNAYRKRIVYKIEQIKRPATAQPLSFKQRQHSSASTRKRQQSAGPVIRRHDDTNKQEKLANEVTQQLPNISINEISQDNKCNQTSNTRSQRPASCISSTRSKTGDLLRGRSRSTYSAKSKRPENSYSEMRLHICGQTKSLFVSKF
ncbi:trichohyalin-like [Clytia hemisphaerica]|uniref:trichohyalin-like n=1 Tax=Clytia hemisphaerica TaxID=252671 RepID=UPI0034D7A5DE